MFWDLKKIIEKLKKMTSAFKARKGCSTSIQCQQLLAPYKARITLKKAMVERDSLHLTDAFKPINQI